MTKRLAPEQIMQQINSLRLSWPDYQDEESWLLSLESETDVHEFLRQVERKRQEAKFLAESVRLNIEELEKRHARFEAREEAMRNLAFKLMQLADLPKAELPEATISIRAGTRKVIITDEEAIPDTLMRVKREPDKVKLKESLLEGPVPGAFLSNAEPTISIRTR